jgi:DNA-binding MarR family transcriptional regulator
MSPLSLKDELNLEQPIETVEHECLLNVIFTGTLIDKISGRYFAGSGITDAQFNVLMQLKYTQEQGLAQVELAKRLVVNKANITGVIDRLEKAGLVRREQHGTDRRIKVIHITDKGMDLIGTVEAGYFEAIGKIMSGFTEWEMEGLTGALQKMREGIRKSGLL